MMKKLSIICSCALILGLIAGPAVAQVPISYCKDFLEGGNPGGLGVCDILDTPCSTDSQCADGALTCLTPSLKTWDETWDMEEGTTTDMDIWLNDVPEALLTGGFFITYDVALINISNVVPSDTGNGGLWDSSFTSSFEVEPGQWFLSLGNFGCVEPDGEGDILLATVTFQCQAVGEVDITVSTIPDFDTVVACDTPLIYDPEIVPNIVVVTQTSGAICTVPADCADDGDLCTTAECVEGTCVYNPVVCDDPDLCTLSSCNPADGNCVDVPVDCDDGDDCTTDSCDPATGCSNEAIECDDGDPCTINGCDPETGCMFEPVDCNDDDVCTDDICNPVTGFCSNDLVVDCSDGDLCTDDICDPGDGQCSNPPVECDDGVECTDDSCDPASGCMHEANDGNCPDDGIVCTDAICDPVDDCQSEDNCPTGEFCNVGGSDVCELVDCSIRISPSSPEVNVLGTVNFNVAVDGTCPLDPSYTWDFSEEGCMGDSIASAIGSTVDQTGLYTAGDRPGTDIVRLTDEANGDLCATAEVTVVRGSTTTTIIPPTTTTTIISGPCTEDADCDDGIDCTDDSCADETCENLPNDDSCPDDGLYCNGEEFCDESDGCSSSGNPCAANETCDEETDSCLGACAIDVLRDSMLKSHWGSLPAVFRIETVGIENISISTPVTVECESDGMGPFGSNAILQLITYPLPNLGTNTTVILHLGITLPAWLTGSQEMESETCTVTVGDCQATDTFELEYLSVIGIPLSE